MDEDECEPQPTPRRPAACTRQGSWRKGDLRRELLLSPLNVAELNKEGTIKDNAGQSIGAVEGFSYDCMTTLAAYFLLVDSDVLWGSRRF